jgi:hypothetical protein
MVAKAGPRGFCLLTPMLLVALLEAKLPGLLFGYLCVPVGRGVAFRVGG